MREHHLFEFRLNSGSTVYVNDIFQRFTYAYQLEGYPNVRLNEALISDLQSFSAQLFPRLPVHVIPGTEKVSPEKVSSSMGIWTELPPITCIGRLYDVEPVSDQNKDYSGLSLIWFQDSMAPPIGASIVEYIRNMNWSLLASDLSY